MESSQTIRTWENFWWVCGNSILKLESEYSPKLPSGHSWLRWNMNSSFLISSIKKLCERVCLIAILRSWWSAICSCNAKCKVFMSRVAVCAEILWEGVWSGFPPASFCFTDAKQVLLWVLFQHFPKSICDMIGPYSLSMVILYPLVWCSALSSDWSFWWETAEMLFSVYCLRMDTIFTLLYDISGEQRIWIWIWNRYRNNPQIDQIHVWQQRERRHQFFSLGRESYSTVGKWKITFSPFYNSISYLWGSLAFCFSI